MDLSSRRTGQLKGICRLCDTEARLEESHIIPAFVYKWLKVSAAASFMRFGTQPNKRVQDGFKRFWLCRKCEDTLNGWETKFANELFYSFNKGKADRVSYDRWLLKFCVSISWRVLTLFVEENQLTDFPEELQEETKNALAIWKKFLLDALPHPGPHQQHFLPWDAVEAVTDKNTPVNINRYILRSIDVDAVRSKSTAFVYSKLGRFMILGFISSKHPRHWEDTMVHLRGTIQPQRYVLPAWFGDYVYSRARRTRRGLLMALSERQKEKTRQDSFQDIDRTANSETFSAVDHDVKLFGKRVFEIEEDN